MSQLKKVLITLPDYLIDELDDLAKYEKKDRSDIVREVMKTYLNEHRKEKIKSELIMGYQQMANVNLALAQDCLDADEENLRHYEEKIAECE